MLSQRVGLGKLGLCDFLNDAAVCSLINTFAGKVQIDLFDFFSQDYYLFEIDHNFLNFSRLNRHFPIRNSYKSNRDSYRCGQTVRARARFAYQTDN